MKYFVSDSRSFPDHGVKFKAGQVVDLTADTAAVYNGIVPGMFQPYDAEKHTPTPKVEEATPETPVPTPEETVPSPFVATPPSDTQDAE